MYRGVTSSGRAVAGLVLDDNSFYAVYSAINNPSLTGGSIQGTIMASGGNFSVTDAIDESVEGFGTRAVAITGTYSQRQFIKGSIGYPPTTQPISFVANYDADYESAPNLSIVAGTYTGTSKASIGSENVTLRISASGEVEGIGTSGCSFEGTIKPRSAGNAYVVNMTFGRAPCAYPGAALTGISYFDRTTNLSYTVASVQGQSTKFILIALKQ
jgi:hypothetical protein